MMVRKCYWFSCIQLTSYLTLLAAKIQRKQSTNSRIKCQTHKSETRTMEMGFCCHSLHPFKLKNMLFFLALPIRLTIPTQNILWLVMNTFLYAFNFFPLYSPPSKQKCNTIYIIIIIIIIVLLHNFRCFLFVCGIMLTSIFRKFLDVNCLDFSKGNNS